MIGRVLPSTWRGEAALRSARWRPAPGPATVGRWWISMVGRDGSSAAMSTTRWWSRGCSTASTSSWSGGSWWRVGRPGRVELHAGRGAARRV